jgi:hypothetical protein
MLMLDNPRSNATETTMLQKTHRDHEYHKKNERQQTVLQKQN